MSEKPTARIITIDEEGRRVIKEGKGRPGPLIIRHETRIKGEPKTIVREGQKETEEDTVSVDPIGVRPDRRR